MSTQSTRRAAGPKSASADPVRESAHEIWLAGLGAFNKAQEEGGKMFDALVQEGLAMQRKAQATAEAKFSEATQKVSTLAQELGGRATGQWDKLESLFEERVARALDRLGIPSAREVKVLSARLTELEAQLQARGGPARKAPSAKKAVAKKTPARKAARRKTG